VLWGNISVGLANDVITGPGKERDESFHVEVFGQKSGAAISKQEVRPSDMKAVDFVPVYAIHDRGKSTFVMMTPHKPGGRIGPTRTADDNRVLPWTLVTGTLLTQDVIQWPTAILKEHQRVRQPVRCHSRR